MMKEYKKTIILSGIALLFIILIAVFMTNDIDFGLFKNLSIASLSKAKQDSENLIARELTQETNYLKAKDDLKTAENDFDVAKDKYESIDESTISTVLEATKDEKYFIEYLWIVLGNYAADNKLDIDIVTATTSTSDETNINNEEKVEENVESTTVEEENATTSETGIKITVVGRYSNVADFVFDVENDRDLKFKLDNIRMTYASDNKVSATFDVISLTVVR